ncbi:MFS transporter [Alicyclobacillus fastidiosus]|uniref:MFS transporter n=1 Tax=Alicyclobacillus fastidiosus TaxID=392011 RepID=A0ABV5A9Q2_9BACL|nr:MFS transporter [Alicyclobacillus fastidiosus]WEH10915.1 MFS transporter [Alicyclobacillus fastidiosus]
MTEPSVIKTLNEASITTAHRSATFVVSLGLFFDLYDIFLAGVLGTVLAQQFHISSTLLPLVIGSSFLGMFLGAIILNRFADIWGRKRAFMFNLLFFSIFTFIGAISPNVTILIICRFLAGFGIGAETPLCDVYLTELLPSASRGKFIAWAYTFGFLAMPIEGFIAQGLVPTHLWGVAGWRWMFIIGSLGAFFAWILQSQLPESPRWLESVGRTQEARRNLRQFVDFPSQKSRTGTTTAAVKSEPQTTPKSPVSLLFSKSYLGRTLMLWVFQVLQAVGYYGFGTLVPIVLAAKGYNIVHSLEFVALTFIGYPVGSLLSLPFVERMERKWLIVWSAIGMALFGILFGIAGSSTLIVIFGFIYTLISNIFSNALHIFQAEIFPTNVRATAAGSAYSLSRLMSGLMPFVLLPVLKQDGATAMFLVVAAAMVLIVIDIGLFGPKTVKRDLETVNSVGDSLGL